MAKQLKEERNLEYRQRVQSYLISREFISSLYLEGFITEMCASDSHSISLLILRKCDAIRRNATSNSGFSLLNKDNDEKSIEEIK